MQAPVVRGPTSPGPIYGRLVTSCATQIPGSHGVPPSENPLATRANGISVSIVGKDSPDVSPFLWICAGRRPDADSYAFATNSFNVVVVRHGPINLALKEERDVLSAVRNF